MKNVKGLSRRRLLGRIGQAGAVGMLAPLLRHSQALGADGVPRRLLLLYANDGMMKNAWQHSGSGKGYQMSSMFSPLNDYRDDLIFFQNLEMVSTWADPTSPGNAHRKGATHALNGANRASGGRLPGAASIDQVLAQHLRGQGVVTRLPSLEMHVSTRTKVEIGLAAQPNSELPHIYWPRDSFKRAFPNGASEQPVVMVDDSPQRKRERVFGLVREQFSRIEGKLSGADREKIAQHLQSISDLETRLTIPTTGNGPAPSKTLEQLVNSGQPKEAAAQYNHRAEGHIKVAAAALHADVTRIASINIDNPADSQYGYSAGQLGATDWHDLTHQVNGGGSGAGVAVIKKQKEVLLGKIKMVLDELASRRESDGKRLLDHTCVLYCSHIADGSHAIASLPWFIAGGTEYFDNGQYIPFSKVTRRFDGKDRTVGRPHNDVLNLVANYMGMDVSTYGNKQVATGPVAEALRA